MHRGHGEYESCLKNCPTGFSGDLWNPEKTHHPMKVRRGVQKLSGAVFCIPHRRDNAFFPSSYDGWNAVQPTACLSVFSVNGYVIYLDFPNQQNEK